MLNFRFDDVMYHQIDCLVMGIPLGPFCTHYFVCWSRILDVGYFPLYCRLVTIVAYFAVQDYALEFKRTLDNLHPALMYNLIHRRPF